MSRVLVAVVAILAAAGVAIGQDGARRARYLEDFAFVKKAVESEAAALDRHRAAWKEAVARLEPEAGRSESDAAHVRVLIELLASLGDSHTGLWGTTVDRKELPSKWDGLYGGGLWFAWEDGRIMLRGVMAGHAQAPRLPPGAALTAIDGLPAWLAMEREKRRITTHQGSSSDHSLFSSLGNRFLPFGEAQEVELQLVTEDGEVRSEKVRRWGPGGKAFQPAEVELPEGLAWAEGAIAKMLGFPWCAQVGYLRVTGSMDEASEQAFHRAFDQLKGMEALLLDCRGMGGGSDHPAWRMAGRLFPKAVPNGSSRTLEPTGSWQFDGPVVMLQDELEVSSAETFTWALSETRRVVSVGRPTGGWGIVPKVMKCPSGLFDFRLGVNDRPTPIQGVHTEGVGWPPDVLVPYGPVFCAQADPVRSIGLEILQVLHAGVAGDEAAKAFGQLFAGDLKAFERAAAGFERRAKGWKGDALARAVREDLDATLRLELALLRAEAIAAPDVPGALRRLDALEARAKKAGLAAAAQALRKTAAALGAEAKAAEALLALLDRRFVAEKKEQDAFLKRHGRTRLARAAAAALFR